MIMKCLVLILGALAFAANAEVIGVVDAGADSMVVLHNIPGPCVGHAQFAEYVQEKRTNIPGCWILSQNGKGLFVVFFDTDFFQAPTSLIRQPGI
jgi:hypothetical protein